MIRPNLSPAAWGVLRGLLARAGDDRDRILLTNFRSTDWQSLTFVGERHELELAIGGEVPDAVLARIARHIGDAEFSIARHLLADILVCGEPERRPDGSLLVRIEALTIAE